MDYTPPLGNAVLLSSDGRPYLPPKGSSVHFPAIDSNGFGRYVPAGEIIVGHGASCAGLGDFGPTGDAVGVAAVVGNVDDFYLAIGEAVGEQYPTALADDSYVAAGAAAGNVEPPLFFAYGHGVYRPTGFAFETGQTLVGAGVYIPTGAALCSRGNAATTLGIYVPQGSAAAAVGRFSNAVGAYSPSGLAVTKHGRSMQGTGTYTCSGKAFGTWFPSFLGDGVGDYYASGGGKGRFGEPQPEPNYLLVAYRRGASLSVYSERP